MRKVICLIEKRIPVLLKELYRVHPDVLIVAFPKRYAKVDSTAVILLTFLFLNLIMDYGAVTYYEKGIYFMFMIFCLHYEDLRRGESAAANAQTRQL